MQYYDQNGSNSGMPPVPGGVNPPPNPYYPPSQPVTPPVVPSTYGAPGPMHPGAAQIPYVAPGTVPARPGDKAKIPDRKSVATKLVEVVYLLTIILESALALRFIFKLLGGSSNNVFLGLLYNTTEVFTFPFQGLFGYQAQNSVSVSNYDLEFTTLVAIGIYALIAFIIVKIIDIFR